MKLEKFRVGKKKKITIISTIILVFLLMLVIIIYQSYALYEDKKTFNVLNGTVPVFGSTTGTIELAYTIDGEKKNAKFPNKDDGYIAKNVTCENNISANWNNIEWALVVNNTNNNEKVICTVDFVKKKIEIYGIEREIASTSSAWTRTNDAVGKVANAQFSATAVQNDFDSIYPWSDMKSYNYSLNAKQILAKYGESGFKFDGSNGEVLTYIPEFYYQRYQDGTKEYIGISKEYIEGFTKSDAFSVGRYTISGSSAGVHSKSGVLPLTNETITNFRTYAKNLGSGFGQMDYHYFIIQMLYLVEYADYNSQAKLGLGYTNSTNTGAIQSGGCNSLGMHSGTLNNDGKHSMIYRGLEDIYGNINQFIDGINIKEDYQVYICYNPTEYEINKYDGCYKTIGYSNSSMLETGYVSQLGYDSNNSLIALPINANGTSNTYITDSFGLNNGNMVARVGGNYTHDLEAGLWRWNYYASSQSNGNTGARLIKYN